MREIRRQSLGDDSPDTLSTMHELGVLYRELALYDRANELLAQVVTRAGHASGNDDDLSLWAAYNLGDASRRPKLIIRPS